jgi:hypothetical protein
MSDLTLSPALPPVLVEAITQFDQWGASRLERQQATDRIVTPLYHYTDATGIEGIFKTQQLWFTDYRHLNDPSELRHGMAIVRAVLGENLVDGDGRVDLFRRVVDDLFSLENVDGNLAFFVGSLSRERDDLGQWRTYADNGRGFAIGFAPGMFTVRDDVSGSPDENAFLGPVQYGPDQITGRHREAIGEAIRVFRETADANVDLLRDSAVGMLFIRELALHLIASVLIWNCLTAKHHAYSAENEVRLIIMGTTDVLRGVIRTRRRGNELVPFIGHPWRLHAPGAVEEIVVGPSASAAAEHAVRSLLISCGLDGVPIRRSEIPYRAL